MIKVSKSVLLHSLIKLLIIFVLAKIISLLSLWYLPSDGVELSQKTSKQPEYRRIDFNNMIKGSNTQNNVRLSSIKTNNATITNMFLKGLYGAGDSGYAIVALKNTPNKTSIIAVGEEFSSYKLTFIKNNGVIFTRNSKEYVLYFKQMKGSSRAKRIQKQSFELEQNTHISRNDIKHYSKNPKQIWKDISIIDYKVNNKLTGFKITRIKNYSKFATLGLKAQDIIIKVNNIRLTSYKEVFDIYNKLDKLQTIQIIVLRNKEEKEFIYEIN